MCHFNTIHNGLINWFSKKNCEFLEKLLWPTIFLHPPAFVVRAHSAMLWDKYIIFFKGCTLKEPFTWNRLYLYLIEDVIFMLHIIMLSLHLERDTHFYWKTMEYCATLCTYAHSENCTGYNRYFCRTYVI